VHPAIALNQLAILDVSEGQLFTAAEFLDSVYGDAGEGRAGSRAQTPMMVSFQPETQTPAHPLLSPAPSWGSYKSLLGLSTMLSPKRRKISPQKESIVGLRPVNTFGRITRSVAKLKHDVKEPSAIIYPTLPIGSSSSKRIPSIAAMPRKPTVDHITVPIEDNCEYAIMVSMYEVYNDKIFDLLADSGVTTKTAAKRKQVLFKNTSWSHDRKVVTGLRKIVCGSLEEALMVLETGLLERRVTGTGSNAVSSRSHGFFCIDVKRRRKSGVHWVGNTLSIVDLAGMSQGDLVLRTVLTTLGSERARTANTAGSTLAEAGKINESLMYLGQCMQIQSDISSGVSDPSKIVPFRQCKLTELLFSNSFSTSSSSQALQPRPQQQKAIMIVTADPRGDFNATSQILRYSALAREVTVPRIPSVTSTILNPIKPSISIASLTTPHTGSALVSSNATAPAAHCTSCLSRGLELNSLNSMLASERTAHMQELEELEIRIRTECWDAFELQQEKERAAHAAAREEEQERLERHIDSKVDVVVRGLGAMQDEGESGINEAGFSEEIEEMRQKMQQMEKETRFLKEKVKVLEKERDEKRRREEDVGRTPSRKIKVLKARPWNVDETMGVENEFL
jgi:hypothetical protein